MLKLQKQEIPHTLVLFSLCLFSLPLNLFLRALILLPSLYLKLVAQALMYTQALIHALPRM